MKTSKSSIRKPLLLLILTSSILSACNYGQNTKLDDSPTTIPKILKLNDTKSGIILGAPAVNMTYSGAVADINVISNNPYITLNIDDPILYSNEQTFVDFDQNLTSQELLKKLGIDGSLKGAYKDLSGDFAADYLEQEQSAANEISTTLYARTTALIRLAQKYPLSQGASSLPTEAIGDSYISAAQGGLFVEATVHVQFDSTTIKNDILAKGDIKYGNLLELAGSFAKLDDNIKKHIKVKVELVQRGGDTAEIYSALRETVTDLGEGKNIDETKPFFLTSIGIDNAHKVIDSIQNYIAGNGYTNDNDISFKAQVAKYMSDPKTKDIKLTKIKDTAKIYITANDLAAQKYQEPVETYSPDSDLRKLVNTHSQKYTALLNLSAAYSKYFAAIDEYKDTFLNPPSGMKNASQNKMDLMNLSSSYTEHAKECYGLVSNPENIQNCKNLLRNDESTAEVMISNISSLGWDKGYKLRGGAAPGSQDQEYLIPIGADEENITYYMVYSKLPSSSIYGVGAIYALEGNSIYNKYMPDPTDESAAIRTLKFSAKGVKISSAFITLGKDITYMNLKDESVSPQTGMVAANAPSARVSF